MAKVPHWCSSCDFRQHNSVPGWHVQISHWAQQTPMPAPNGVSRKVLLNTDLRFSSRAYGPLGPGLRIIKLRSPLATLLGKASTFSPAHVRPECIAAVRCVAALLATDWARCVYERGGWPQAAQLELLAKRFGGALSRADVLGADGADDEASAAAEAATAALLRGGGSALGSAAAGVALLAPSCCAHRRAVSSVLLTLLRCLR